MTDSRDNRKLSGAGTLKGSYRSVSDIVNKYKIVQHVEDLSDYCDLGFHVFCYHGPESEFGYTKQSNRHYGKGTTRLRAQCSGLYEAVERVSALFRGGSNIVTGSYNELSKQHRMYNPLSNCLPSASDIGNQNNYFSDICVEYTSDSIIDWCWCYSLFDQGTILVPVCLTHTLSLDDSKNRFITNRPNGLASGVTLQDAVLHGIFEVIERDANTIFTGNSLPMPQIDVNTIGVRHAAGFLRRARGRKVKVIIKDITTDIGLPTFYTYLEDNDFIRPLVSWGVGCHLSKDLALLRSITEACQDRAARQSGYDMYRKLSLDNVAESAKWEFEFGRNVLLRRDKDATRYLYDHKKMTDYRSLESAAASTPDEALSTVLARLSACGIRDVFVANLTTYGIPTVRVIVPALEFIPKYFYRSAPGTSRRLFDVPVALGYEAGSPLDYAGGPMNNLLI